MAADINKLLGGRYCRVLVAPLDGTPTPPPIANLADGFALSGAGGPVAPYRDVGSIGDEVSYEREIEAEGFRIRELTSEVLEEITEVNRSFEFVLNEVTPENFALFEAAKTVTTVAAAANRSAQKIVKAGHIDELPRYRVMLVFRRKFSQVPVIEVGGGKRGGYVAICFQLAALQADDSEVEAESDSLVSLPIAMKVYPEPTLPVDQAQVALIEEQAGTISGV